MLRKATGRSPYVIGKPKPDMVNMAINIVNLSSEETVVVGDRLYTDIACGVNAGVDTILVLSGETKREDVKTSSVKPTFILQDIKELLEILKSS